jgi:hypothetical protein
MSGAINQGNLGARVSSRVISWMDLAMRAWGSEYRAPDHKVYQFTGRDYDSTDQSKGGVYGLTTANAPNYLMLEDSHYPDMASNSHLLQDDGTHLVLE